MATNRKKKFGAAAVLAVLLGVAGVSWTSTVGAGPGANPDPGPGLDGAGPETGPGLDTPPGRPAGALDLPVVATRDITRPGDVTVSAWFHNGQVYRLVTPTRTFEIEHPGGLKGIKIVGGTSWVENLDGKRIPEPPPHDPKYDNVHPTPEQLALIHQMTDD